MSACRKLKFDSCLSPCTSYQLRGNPLYIKDLNIIPENLKLVQERSGNTLELRDIRSNFLNRTQMALKLREIIDKWDYIKLKSFFTTKEMVTTMKKQM
jgi:hypothetical protein